MLPRVTADTNIYVSALVFGGQPERLLRLAEAGAIQLITSGPILDEVAKVLRDKKFAWPEDRIEQAISELSYLGERVVPTQKLDIIKADPSDNRILECAEAGMADYIITGDKKHILPLGSHAGIPIVTLTEFLRQLKGTTGHAK